MISILGGPFEDTKSLLRTPLTLHSVVTPGGAQQDIYATVTRTRLAVCIASILSADLSFSLCDKYLKKYVVKLIIYF